MAFQKEELPQSRHPSCHHSVWDASAGRRIYWHDNKHIFLEMANRWRCESGLELGGFGQNKELLAIGTLHLQRPRIGIRINGSGRNKRLATMRTFELHGSPFSHGRLAYSPGT